MPTLTDLRVEQKRRLAMLLRLKNATDPAKFQEILDAFITDTIIEMDAADVAYVQKILG